MQAIMRWSKSIVKRKIYRITIDKIDHSVGRQPSLEAQCTGAHRIQPSTKGNTWGQACIHAYFSKTPGVRPAFMRIFARSTCKNARMQA
jgi:hypothetical protein